MESTGIFLPAPDTPNAGIPSRPIQTEGHRQQESNAPKIIAPVKYLKKNQKEAKLSSVAAGFRNVNSQPGTNLLQRNARHAAQNFFSKKPPRKAAPAITV